MAPTRGEVNGRVEGHRAEQEDRLAEPAGAERGRVTRPAEIPQQIQQRPHAGSPLLPLRRARIRHG